MAKPSVVPVEDPQALHRLLVLGVGQQQAVAGQVAPADAAAQLVDLGQAVAFGVLDDHDRGARHVDADLDDGGGDEDLEMAGGERVHDLLLLDRRASGRAAGRRACQQSRIS